MKIIEISTVLVAVFTLMVTNLTARGGAGFHGGGGHMGGHGGGFHGGGFHGGGFHGGGGHMGSINHAGAHHNAKTYRSQSSYPKAHNAAHNHPNDTARAKNAAHNHPNDTARATNAAHNHNGSGNHGTRNLNNDHNDNGRRNLNNDHNSNHNWDNNNHPNWNGGGWGGAGLAAGALAMGGLEGAAMMGAAAESVGNAGFIAPYPTEMIAAPTEVIPGGPVIQEVAGRPVIQEVDPAPETIVIEQDSEAKQDVKKKHPNHSHHADDRAEQPDPENSKKPTNGDNSLPPPVVINNITMAQPATIPTKLTAEMMSKAPSELSVSPSELGTPAA